ncbi:unnamed protein product [Staurois parvus]|uniref:Uncharacterized protein n=1 Tax=Staurois parvus TaxID=386267 RepID=A0ABN9BV69_9NEOB|nr:unnamed protein product [Staurois parvus]
MIPLLPRGPMSCQSAPATYYGMYVYWLGPSCEYKPAVIL